MDMRCDLLARSETTEDLECKDVASRAFTPECGWGRSSGGSRAQSSSDGIISRSGAWDSGDGMRTATALREINRSEAATRQRLQHFKVAHLHTDAAIFFQAVLSLVRRLMLLLRGERGVRIVRVEGAELLQLP